MAFKKGQSGNPKGRPAGTGKPHISQYWSEAQIREYFEFICDAYKEDSRIAVWVGDQISGKAAQSIDHTTGGAPLPQPLLYVLDNEGDDKNSKA